MVLALPFIEGAPYGEKIGAQGGLQPSLEGIHLPAGPGKRLAEVVERAPSPDPSAVPWLLLRVTSTGASGDFSGAAYIQRLDTTGGLAPTGGCDAERVGAVARVPYTAVYAFYGAP